jgi:PBSX family phage terminase large subunit
MKILLSKPQLEFVSASEQFPAFVGGFGSGKSHAAIMRAVALKLQYPKQNVAYYLPTYDLVRTIGFPRFSEILEQIGIPFKINKSDAVIDFAGFGTIIFRTMDTPERIIGYEVADSLVDELDTLQTEKAREVWNKIISRNRQKKPDGKLNTVGVATTPEGFRFVYERWQKSPAEGYRLIKANTRSNSRNLPQGYIASLESIYPSNLLSAYLDGEFVNLTAGSVYPSFDRRLNATYETIKEKEPLHIGLDFNVTKMSAVIHVLRNDEPHAVMEYTGVFDTPAMIQIIKQNHAEHKIFIYPDASGQARKSNNASVSDLSLLRQANFQVMVNSTNPAVKDRVLAMNKLISDRRYKVNPDKCPELVESLERQAYDKNGEPDKSGGFDHVLDATGYCISYRYPILRNTMQRIKTTGT